MSVMIDQSIATTFGTNLRRAIGGAGRLLGVGLVVASAGVWQLAATYEVISPAVFPPITTILSRWWELMVSGVLVNELLPSLYRMAAGYVIAVIIGVTVGAAMGYFRVVFNVLDPAVELLRPIPSPAYIPLVIMILGIEDGMKVFMIAIACIFPIIVNTMAGISGVHPLLVETGKTFGLGRLRILLSVALPAAAPSIFAGLRISLAVGLMVVVISEMVAANDGIGNFILFAQRTFRATDMYAGILTLGIVGYLLNECFVAVRRRALRWHERDFVT